MELGGDVGDRGVQRKETMFRRGPQSSITNASRISFSISPATDPRRHGRGPQSGLVEAADSSGGDNLLSVVLFRKGSEFRVEFLNLAPETVKPADVEKELEKFAEEIAKKGGEQVESKAVTIGEGDRKTAGRDFSFKRESGATSRCRMTLIGDKFYMASTTTSDAEVAGRFLKSFVPSK